MGGFLNEGENFAVGLRNHNSKTARVLYLSKHDGPLLPLLPLKSKQFGEGVVADDVAIEDEEEPLLVVFPEDIFCKFKRTGCPQRLSLLGVGNLNLVLLLERLQRVLDVVGLVVDGDHDFDDSDFSKGLDGMKHTSI